MYDMKQIKADRNIGFFVCVEKGGKADEKQLLLQKRIGAVRVLSDTETAVYRQPICRDFGRGKSLVWFNARQNELVCSQ